MAYPIAKRVLFPILKSFVKEIKGIGNIPYKAFIIASNHESYIDSALLCAIVIPKINKNVHYLAVARLLRSPIRKLIWKRWAHTIPVYFDKRKGLAIKEAVSVLKKGEIIGIFPEGPKKDSRMKKGKTGVIRIALNAKVPVLPVGLKNTYKVLPMEKWIPRIYRKIIKVNIGKPMYFDYSKRYNKKDLRSMTNKLMKEIIKLKNEI